MEVRLEMLVAGTSPVRQPERESASLAFFIGEVFMSKFEAGDQALIIGSRSGDSPNIGKGVELVAWLNPGDPVITTDGISRKCAADYSVWQVIGNGLLARNVRERWVDAGGVCLVEERFLMPLRGDFQPEQPKAKEEIV